MKVYIGSDHAGYQLKETLRAYISELGYDLEDKGPFEYKPNDDYPDLIRPVAELVANNKGSLGIILGASGQGEEMVANKVDGVRAAEYYGGNLEIVRLARQHNDANILSLGAKFVTEEQAESAVKIFLETPFSGEVRHIRRIKKI